MAPSVAAAMKLREEFGDRKIPDISRKITACVACRKLKTKCYMDNDQPPCKRCKARGLPCTINKSLQMLLEGDASWKEMMEERINSLERALSNHPNQNAATSPTGVVFQSPISNNVTNSALASPSSSRSLRDRSALNLDAKLGTFPASSLDNAAATISDTVFTAVASDFISRGKVLIETALNLFAFYKDQLDSLVNHILKAEDQLVDIRSRSPMLVAAICTVAALCTGSDDYETILAEYKVEVSQKLFASQYEFDDVRALCVGAFWLSDESAALNGMAVRIGTQLNLHRCISKMPHTNINCYERTRLFFLVLICDHSCSIIYGRPPCTNEWRELKPSTEFLNCAFADTVRPMDKEIISQVELWSITRRVLEKFGADVERSVSFMNDLEDMNNAFDLWASEWQSIVSAQPDDLHKTLLNLSFYSAKLYLFSHIFRGRSTQTPQPTPTAIQPWVDRAFESALSIVRCVTQHRDPSWLSRLPFYFGTVIAFACVCLVKIAGQDQQLHPDRKIQASQELQRLTHILHACSTMGSLPQHLDGIGKSLESVLHSDELHTEPMQLPSEQVFDDDLFDMDFDFGLFGQDVANFNFPRFDDEWMLCPDEQSSIVS